MSADSRRLYTKKPKAEKIERMAPMKSTPFRSPSAFRAWLEKNHDRETELWVGLYNQRARQSGITYGEALDEALCFGWIDGVRRSVNHTTYAVRFTPRKPESKWSAVNIKRGNELRRSGRMAAAGLRVFEQRKQNIAGYSGEERPTQLSGSYEQQFRMNARAWAFFRAQAPWYQRSSSFWVLSAKREATRQRRLQILIGDSAQGRRLKILTRKGDKGR
ncbi:MAG TPA: YdeI/OmpD-associated family protein [Terriglobales bacterium]|nr:YdeI/OmpD-associated family protein [Terriglobales bacterium]